MKTIKINIELKSDTLPGSGEGYGAVIDTDIVFDELGIPFIPAKRIKGCLKDSAREVKDILLLSGNSYFTDIENSIKELFGLPGQNEASGFQFYNLFPESYYQMTDWFKYLNYNYAEIFSKDSILDSFTSIRRQTEIDDKGVAVDHSLRTIRAIRKGLKFIGDILINTDNHESETLLALSCANLRRIGTKRNRGLGEIKCCLSGVNIEETIKHLKDAEVKK